MKAILRQLPFYAFLVLTAAMAACNSPGYNDNPSQQITNGRVGCPAATDFFTVYFSLHVQPYGGNRETAVTKEMFRSYCNHLPMAGRVFLTADLVGGDFRKTPIGIRVVEQIPDGDESLQGIIFEVPPRTYEKGVIESDFEIDQNGSYEILLIRGGTRATTEDDTLIIPLDVGVDAVEKRLRASIIPLLGMAAGLALIAVATLQYWHRRKAP